MTSPTLRADDVDTNLQRGVEDFAAGDRERTGGAEMTSYYSGSGVGTPNLLGGASALRADLRRERPHDRRDHEQLDRSLLKRARELVATIDNTDIADLPVVLESLDATVTQLWLKAVDASGQHQQVLAALEHAARSAFRAGTVTDGQLSAFREAIIVLGLPTVVSAQAAEVRAAFVTEGFGPMDIMD